MRQTDSNPWYRERWPWILMAGPAIVVVAGGITAALAFATSDGLVADDYYKQGLAINRVIAREDRARTLGLEATLQFNDTRDVARVALHGAELPARPPRLTLAHSTRGGFDRTVALTEVAPGLYEGRVPALPAGAWYVQLQDEGATWRLDGQWRGGAPIVKLGSAAR